MSVTIIIIEEGDGAVSRKKLKEAMPEQISKALDDVGKKVEMESGEQMRDKLPPGFPREFVVKEEILVFPDEEEDETTQHKKKSRKRMMEIRNKIIRKSIAGNA